jgi:hypothetical protein
VGRELIDDLVAVIAKHCTDEPIVASATVRFELDERLGERRNHPSINYNGGAFRSAEQAACRGGRFQRWKRLVGKNHVGWSPSKTMDARAYRRAKAWALRKGWKQVEVE